MDALKAEKVAVVTGASRGIGRATALELSSRGFALAICGRSAASLSLVEQEISAGGGEVLALPCDVSNSDSVRSFADAVAHRYPHVNLLFNNAGSGRVLSLQETGDHDWEQIIGSSLTGTFYCSRAFLPLLTGAQQATIVNNASVAAIRGFSGFSAYSAAKGGIAAFSNAIREELRPQNIRVTVLFLGAVDTQYWDGQAGEWNRARMMDCTTIANLIGNIAELPENTVIEEVRIMPISGAL